MSLIVETKPRKAKFGFRYNITIYGTLMEKAKNAREMAQVCEMIHATLGEPDRENWWYETPNRNGSHDELLVYINDIALYEKFKAAVDSIPAWV
jgi:hypothetical protein